MTDRTSRAGRVVTRIYSKKKGFEDKVQINFEEESMHVVITDAVLFNSGSSLLQETALEILSSGRSNVSPDMTESISVIGHTDDRPITNSVNILQTGSYLQLAHHQWFVSC